LKSTVLPAIQSVSHFIFVLKTTTSALIDRVMGTPNVKTHLDHSHVPAMLDIQEMGLFVKV
jgi:hypothetical protein